MNDLISTLNSLWESYKSAVDDAARSEIKSKVADALREDHAEYLDSSEAAIRYDDGEYDQEYRYQRESEFTNYADCADRYLRERSRRDISAGVESGRQIAAWALEG